MDQLAEDRVFLWRSSHDGKRPDGPRAVQHFFHAEDREVVCEAVIAEVIPEGALGQLFVGVDRAGDTKIGVGVDGQAVPAIDHPHPATV